MLGCACRREHSEDLAAEPAARVGNDLIHAVVDGDGRGIRLDGEPAADIALWHTVANPVEVQAEVFVDQGFHGFTIVIRNDRQRPQGIG